MFAADALAELTTTATEPRCRAETPQSSPRDCSTSTTRRRCATRRPRRWPVGHVATRRCTLAMTRSTRPATSRGTRTRQGAATYGRGATPCLATSSRYRNYARASCHYNGLQLEVIPACRPPRLTLPSRHVRVFERPAFDLVGLAQLAQLASAFRGFTEPSLSQIKCLDRTDGHFASSRTTPVVFDMAN